VIRARVHRDEARLVDRDLTSHAHDPIPALMRQLDSLIDGESASAKLAACGPRAIPPLQSFLLHGRPSGVPQPRCWAVRALSGLGAKDVLIAYLEQEPAPDPVVRLAEEAVQREAALALTSWDTPDVFPVLMRAANRQLIPGVIEALARFDRRETVPIFLRALEDDFCRPWAATALEAHVDRDGDVLIRSALDARPDGVHETRASLRRRRALLAVLRSHRLPMSAAHALAPLIDSPDPELAVDACAIALADGPEDDRVHARQRLERLEPDAPWHVHADVTALLNGCGHARPLR
jgi:hypothetical protein